MNAASKIEAASLASALAAAFGEIESATKSANNPHFKSKYADLTTVIEAIKPALIAHDLYFTQRPEPTENGITIETVIGHAGGEELSLGKLFVPANKNDAQGFGSALTYARRYALVTAFGVPVEDDDGNAASKSQNQKPTVVDDAQWSELVQMMEAAEANTKAFCTAYNIGSLRELPAEAFPKAIAQLRKKIDQIAAKTKENA
jgi:hypothetical protein